MSVATALPGSRYRLLAKWGSGGMADVYVARHGGAGGFDKIVAIKLLREQDESTSFREMFLEEVRTAALLNHPNIVQTFDAGELGDRLYMAMEFVNGETLGRFARAVIKSAGSFPCELAIAIVRDLANALEYAHTLTNLDGVPLQLVHRDVSPSNVLVSFDGMVKLLDFGIAKVATQAQLTGAGVIKGKFSYMAPEQARGEHIDQRTDIYSLGLVLWQLLTGRAAFQASSDAELLRSVITPRLLPPSQAGATCSEEVDGLVMAAIAPDPDSRYQTSGEFATALARFLARRAAGFDATKVIRGLMGAHFRERRERVAQLIRSSVREVPLEFADHLANQPSIRTPTPQAAPRVGTVTNQLEAVVPVTVAPTTTHAPEPRGRWQSVALVGLLLVAGGYVAIRETDTPPIEKAPPPASQVAAAPPVATTVTAAPAVNDAAPVPTTDEEGASTDTPAPAVAVAPRTRSSPTAPPPARRAAAPRPSARSQPAREPAARVATAPASASPRPSTTAASARASIVATPPLAPAAEPIREDAAPEPRVTPPAPAPAVDAGAAPPPVVRRARPVETAGSLDAVPRVSRIGVDGSLPTSEIRTAMDRAESAMRACYRSAAKRAARTPAFAIRVSFEIDEARAARRVRIAGDALGLAGCVSDALSGIRTRVAPDVGTVNVTAVIKFDPIED